MARRRVAPGPARRVTSGGRAERVQPGRPGWTRPSWSAPPRRATGRRSTSWSRRTYVDTYTLALRLTGNEEDARDVVQEAYLRAYRGHRSGSAATPSSRRGCTGSPPTARPPTSAKRRPPPPRGARATTSSPPTTGPRSTRRRSAERRASCGTGSRRRARTTSRRGCGPSSCCATSTTCPTRRSPHELGITESAAKVRLHRARKKLRERAVPDQGEESARAV